MLYIEDFINAIKKGISSNERFDILNIGNGNSYSIFDLVGIIGNAMNKKLQIKSLNQERENEIFDTCADISRAKEVLNWVPKINIEQGILNTIKYMEYKQSE